MAAQEEVQSHQVAGGIVEDTVCPVIGYCSSIRPRRILPVVGTAPADRRVE